MVSLKACHQPGLPPADLGCRALKVLGNLFASEPCGLAEPSELERQPTPPDGRTLLVCHVSPPGGRSGARRAERVGFRYCHHAATSRVDNVPRVVRRKPVSSVTRPA